MARKRAKTIQIDTQGRKLRKALEKATKRNRNADIVSVLRKLSEHEPAEPRWPQRLGDALKRSNRQEEAEVAYVNAMKLFSDQGFLPQAVAIGKLIVALNPQRTDVLDNIDPKQTRALRFAQAAPTPAPAPVAQVQAPTAQQAPPPVAAPVAAPVADADQAPTRVPPPAPARQLDQAPTKVPPPKAAADPSLGARPPTLDEERTLPMLTSLPEWLRDARQNISATQAKEAVKPATPLAAAAPEGFSFIGGMPSSGLAVGAQPLEPVAEGGSDEVRFNDIDDEDSFALCAEDIEVIVEAEEQTDERLSIQMWSGQNLAHLSASGLLAEISQAALGKLAHAAELSQPRAAEFICRKGDPADALFIIVEGTAHVVLPALAAGGVDLAAGQVFGEACLLQDGRRQADVRAKAGVVLLRIPKDELQSVAAEHSELHALLFELLIGRIVVNAIQTHPLFAGFDVEQRKKLAGMFELRRVPANVSLQLKGKLCDGLYVLLAGQFERTDGPEAGPLSLGTMVGYRSVSQRSPSPRTVTATSESVVLRLPWTRLEPLLGEQPADRPPTTQRLPNFPVS